MAGRHRRNGVVKQLSNLSIDEVSLVDRGANQHASVQIAKRAPEASDYFVDKSVFGGLSKPLESAYAHQAIRGISHANAASEATGVRRALHTGASYGHLATAKGLGAAADHPDAAVAGAALGAGAVIHHHFGESHFHKAMSPADFQVLEGWVEKGFRDCPECGVDMVDEFEKKTGSSFGQGGEADEFDEINTSDDPSGLTKDIAAASGETGGEEGEEGETVPAGNGKGGTKVGKSASFWTDFVSKIMDEDDEEVGKHFPGVGAQNPMNSPFPGAAGPGQPPVMQSVGAHPGAFGQPQAPPMGGQPQPMQGAGAAMGGQLPPEVVQYIQQLEAALAQAQGQDGSGNNDNGNDDSKDKNKNPFGKSGDQMSTDTFLTELAKSLDGEDQREAVSKAMEAVSKAEQRAAEAEKIAKSERDLRLEREFIAKAEEFALPVPAKELGPVLKRMSEGLSKEDLAVIVKCLKASSEAEALFGEIGKRGGGSNSSILDDVEQRAAEIITKSETVSKEQAIGKVFEMNPRAYDEYLADQRTR